MCNEKDGDTSTWKGYVYCLLKKIYKAFFVLSFFPLNTNYLMGEVYVQLTDKMKTWYGV